ncbi:hypothetical protein BT96DRAFT_809638 [Gymnopus androsaceus JB14]|uniref:Sodium/calcium exchanger membrane region domain-containing protein n=1 Tax=Gymnopus androsaceus JB14 TaxID=1447944 RepID=A0A6A4I9Y4_9AGAR|nr:hypothetical protein BT96DRAFT_809638 [Gymnopus androsaceus JB14]
MSNPNPNIPSSPSSDDDEVYTSSTPTPFSNLHAHRGARSPHPHQQQQSSYFSSRHGQRATSPTPRRPSSATRPASSATPAPAPIPILMRSSSAHSTHSTTQRRGMRSTSVSSSSRGFRDDEAVSEADEDVDAEHNDLDPSSADPEDVDDSEADTDTDGDGDGDATPVINNLRARQSLINVQHPFGLPIWKPALYKKSRSVTRYADEALHSIPSAEVEREVWNIANLCWLFGFGWWMAIVLGILADGDAEPVHGGGYTSLIFGLAWYIAWPFGKYVEGVVDDDALDEYGYYTPYEGYEEEDEEDGQGSNHTVREGPAGAQSSGSGDSNSNNNSSFSTIRGVPGAAGHQQTSSWIPTSEHERTSLLQTTPAKSYGALSTAGLGKTTPPSSSSSSSPNTHPSISLPYLISLLNTLIFYILFCILITPLLLIVSLICWGLVLTIPMAKLNWALVRCVWEQPRTVRFCAAPEITTLEDEEQGEDGIAHGDGEVEPEPDTGLSASVTSISAPKLHPRSSYYPTSLSKPGQPRRVVLLCTYRALGLKYYKYTIGGVNIMFVNLLFVVFFVIFDWAVLLAWKEELEEEGRPVPHFLHAVASQGVIFLLSLLSVIPLSYFIGMAVASISAQSSIGMGAVINATFGSIIEILLYSIALVKGKGRLVEGSIVGSLLAGVGLMPGMSMVSSALRRKETRFNAGSAGVTSVMLIMAIVGALTPTLFYQTYGNFQLICTGCPNTPSLTQLNKPWVCDQCYYQHPDPVHDPFYQSTVKSLMFFCAAVLIFSYLVGLWFSLRTHASQIWQNPQQLLNPMDLHTLPVHNPHLAGVHPHGAGGVGGNDRTSLYTKFIPPVPATVKTLSRKASSIIGGGKHQINTSNAPRTPASPTYQRRVSYAPVPATGGSASMTIPIPPQNLTGTSTGTGTGFTPLLESVDQAVKSQTMPSLQLPESASGTASGTNTCTTLNVTTDDFTRAVAVATVSALKLQQQQQLAHSQQHPGLRTGYSHSPARMRSSGGMEPVAHGAGGGHGGHDAPSWSRFTSASVLLGCTALYAVIAEILVDVIDVILGDSGLDEKFLGVTLLALVPNTTEFMNAISFALNGNIALSMEIGSAYALQVCLLQIPAMVAFSAWWFPDKMGEVAHTFSLIFPRWDVIAIILSMFLLTYTYIEAKSNYHRGVSLFLGVYLVLIAGFYYAPRAEDIHSDINPLSSGLVQQFDSLTFWEYARWWLTSL